MKKINVLMAVAALILLSASCNRKVEFEHEPFVTLQNKTFNVYEDDGTIRIPVKMMNPTGKDVQITVAGISGEGKNGAVLDTDFTVTTPAAGVLTFKDSTDIVIDITPFIGELTGTKKFTVQIDGVDGVTMGAVNTATVNILDRDHPLKDFIGTWTGKVKTMAYNGSPEYDMTFNVMPDETDPTYKTLLFDAGIDPFFLNLGYKDAVYKAKAKGTQVGEETVYKEVAIIGGQPNGYQDVVLVGFNDDQSDSDIHYVLNDDGTLSLTSEYGAYTPSGGGSIEVYGIGGATFTKK